MVSAEGIPSTNEIKDLQGLPDLKDATGAKGIFPALANLIKACFGGRP